MKTTSMRSKQTGPQKNTIKSTACRLERGAPYRHELTGALVLMPHTDHHRSLNDQTLDKYLPVVCGEMRVESVSDR